MGSDAGVYPFNYERYRSQVVPAIKHYLLDGQAETWLRKLIDAIECDLSGIKRTDLDRYCHYLDSDLAWNAPYDITNTWFLDWENRSCKSAHCPERSRCPYHENTPPLA